MSDQGNAQNNTPNTQNQNAPQNAGAEEQTGVPTQFEYTDAEGNVHTGDIQGGQDTTGDGNLDTFHADMDGDGVAETRIFDRDGDGNVERVEVDLSLIHI